MVEIYKLIICGPEQKKKGTLAYSEENLFFWLKSSIINFGLIDELSNVSSSNVKFSCYYSTSPMSNLLDLRIIIEIQGMLEPCKLSNSLMVLNPLRKMECYAWNS